MNYLEKQNYKYNTTWHKASGGNYEREGGGGEGGV